MYTEILKKFENLILVKTTFNVYAHTKEEGKIKETLKEHIDRCSKYLEKLIKQKGIVEVFTKFEGIFVEPFSEEVKNLFKEMIIGTIVMHDMGKINPIYQKKIMKNDLNIKNIDSKNDTNHSKYSSIIYIDYYFQKVVELSKEVKISREEQEILLAFILINSYIISKHHGGLGDIEEYIRNYLNEEDEVYENFKEVINPLHENGLKISKNQLKTLPIIFHRFIDKNIKSNMRSSVSIYVYVRYILSCLVACDFYATSEFMNDFEIDDLGNIDDIEEFYSKYKDGEIYKSIRKYEENTYGKTEDYSKERNINVLRTEMFLDAEKVLKENIDKNIFYLEAPTGSGKSNVANNLSFKLIEADKKKKKIFYVYPFNALIDQNIKNIEKVYEGDKNILKRIAVINSLFPIEVEENEESVDFKKYEKALLNRQFLNYPMVLTTHVSIFRYLFGSSREDIFPVHQLANSIVVLDEIQSYKNKIWREIIEFLQGFAEILNMKIIIMSATLPDLDKLLNTEGKSVNLIKDREKYFSHSLFKDRVKVDYSLIKSERAYEDILNEIKRHKGKKILVEFIRKASAYDFYNMLQDELDNNNINSEIRLLTGDDNSVNREKVIEEVKSLDNIILVATQVIEAGVDIDMDIGFKDISIFDSEEQFLGRINRSCKKKGCIVYFFNKDEGNSIYKGDIRIQDVLTLKNDDIKEVLKTKEFFKYYGKVLEKLQELTSRENELNTEKFFKVIVGSINCKEVEKKMKLIEDENNDIQVFLNTTIEVNGKELVGSKVWEEYKNALKDNSLDYAEKMVKLSVAKAKLNYFIYKIRTKHGFTYSDRVGDILYIENGEEYFKNGKLDVEKFKSGVGEFI